MKKVISLLLTAMLLLSMLPATMAEGVEYIPAPYALDAERAGPKAYVEPVFYANGEGEPTIGVTYVGVIKADGKYFKDSNNNHELDPFEDWRLDPETRAADLVAKMSVEQKIGLSLAQMVLMPGERPIFCSTLILDRKSPPTKRRWMQTETWTSAS